MTFLSKLGISAGLSLAMLAGPLLADPVEIKGFYQEDGTYVKRREIDPLPVETKAFPALSADLKLRRAQIERFFGGRVAKAKVSFPACRGGLVIHPDDLGSANADLFRKVSKYGVSIEKDASAIVTGIRVKDRQIDVDLNSGGYGTPWDVTKRVLSGIGSLGYTEVRGYGPVRYQRGSRLRIVAAKPFTKDDLTFEKVSERLALALDL